VSYDPNSFAQQLADAVQQALGNDQGTAPDNSGGLLAALGAALAAALSALDSTANAAEAGGTTGINWFIKQYMEIHF
jgi:hypothetical protein